MEHAIHELTMLFIRNPLFWIFIILAIFSGIFYKKIRGFMGHIKALEEYPK